MKQERDLSRLRRGSRDGGRERGMSQSLRMCSAQAPTLLTRRASTLSSKLGLKRKPYIWVPINTRHLTVKNLTRGICSRTPTYIYIKTPRNMIYYYQNRDTNECPLINEKNMLHIHIME